jgi:cell division protein FtsQ
MVLWKKIMIIAVDVVLGIYLVLAMTAFNKPDEKANICKEIKINIQEEDSEGFLVESDVMQMLRHAKLSLISQPMSNINTRQIEEILEGSDLIDNAECFKAINGALCINIVQRIPIVRIMSNNGEDYYVDNHHEVMQHNNYTCNLLIATGKISKQYASKVLAPVVRQIQADSFWRNQIVQLNVLDDRSIEVIPRVGDHVIYLGQPIEIDKKLDRLRKFYSYGLSQTGWNRYSRINVEFDNQIICKQRPKGRR